MTFNLMCDNDANKMNSPTPYYIGHFQIFSKIDSFLKHVSKNFDSKKSTSHVLFFFWRTTKFKCNCWLAFFLFRFEFLEKIDLSLRNYLKI